MKTRSGFTMIELLVVISIILLLMGILIPTVNRIRNSGRKVEAQGILKNLAMALESYKADVGDYPDEWDEGPDGDLSGGGDSGGTFAWYLINKGISPPYLEPEKYKLHPIDMTKADMLKEKNVRILDPWPFEEREEETGNWIHYCRAPYLGSPTVPGRRYEKIKELNSKIEKDTEGKSKFMGNRQTYNLWSFGPNQKDDSSDTADSEFKDGDPPKYRHPGGDEGPDPDSPEGIGDDIVNWLKK